MIIVIIVIILIIIIIMIIIIIIIIIIIQYKLKMRCILYTDLLDNIWYIVTQCNIVFFFHKQAKYYLSFHSDSYNNKITLMHIAASLFLINTRHNSTAITVY